MTLHITARHLRLTRPIRAYVEEKIQKVIRYFDRVTRVQVVLTVEKLTHCSEIVVHAPGQMFRALGQGSDLYSAIDLASDKIDIQIKKYKERVRNHHVKSPPEPAVESTDAFAASKRFTVVKQVPMRPMSRETAVNEMEAIGHNFWMYLDEESRQVHVLFRRQDDSYGILKPIKWNGK